MVKLRVKEGDYYDDDKIKCFRCNHNLVKTLMSYCSDCKRELAKEMDEYERQPFFDGHNPADLAALDQE